MNGCPLLVIEDSEEDFEVLEMALRKAGAANAIYHCVEGAEALELLLRSRAGEQGEQGREPRGEGRGEAADADEPPGLVLLDLNLSGLDGRQVLQRIRAMPELRTLPVIVFSTSANPRDVEYCYAHGANGYMVKPVDLERLEAQVRAFKEMWLENMILPGWAVGREAARSVS